MGESNYNKFEWLSDFVVTGNDILFSNAASRK